MSGHFIVLNVYFVKFYKYIYVRLCLFICPSIRVFVQVYSQTSKQFTNDQMNVRLQVHMPIWQIDSQDGVYGTWCCVIDR